VGELRRKHFVRGVCGYLAAVSATPGAGQPSHPLPEPLGQLIAHGFCLPGEPMPLRVVDHLRGGEASVGALLERPRP